MYDAMAEEEKTGEVDTKLESEAERGNTEVKTENDVPKEPSSSLVCGEERSSVQKAEVNGAEKSPVAPVIGVGQQNGKETMAKPEEKDKEPKPEAEQDNEGPEGSRSLDAEHYLRGWVDYKRSIS